MPQNVVYSVLKWWSTNGDLKMIETMRDFNWKKDDAESAQFDELYVILEVIDEIKSKSRTRYDQI